MAFTDYKNLAMVVQRFDVTYSEEDFLTVQHVELHPYFLEDLVFARRHMDTKVSEYALCEALVYPLLKEIYKKYASHFVLWSHRSLTYDADLSGTPDYMLATPSALGRIVFGHPVVLLVEAKRNDFVEGWGQYAAAMVAAQKLNGDPTFAVYGIVTDGEVWRVGKLVADTFVDHPTFYTINDVSELVGALDGVLATVQRQIVALWRPAQV